MVDDAADISLTGRVPLDYCSSTGQFNCRVASSDSGSYERTLRADVLLPIVNWGLRSADSDGL